MEQIKEFSAVETLSTEFQLDSIVTSIIRQFEERAVKGKQKYNKIGRAHV